ncbi:hypothetical protein [Paraburkholderia sp. SIMBA_054]|uniref:hypothetical protein n=1 Tax=Paraburkholderia TaxID=1822464 RepID=UPI00397C2A83
MIECVKLFFGAGVFAWLAMESVIPHRMFHAAPPVGCDRSGAGQYTRRAGIARAGHLGIWRVPVAMVAPASAVDHEAAVRAVVLGVRVALAAMIVGTGVRAWQGKRERERSTLSLYE